MRKNTALARARAMATLGAMKYSLLSLFLASALVGCGDNMDDHDHPDAPVVEPDAAEPQAVTIAFAAEVGGTPFVCGQSYAGVGTGGSAYVGTDFRFYVHDVALVGATGDVPVTLDINEFQADGIALLDFETGGTGCQMGSPSTHTAVTGTVPAGAYTGVKFKVGVPFAKNHLDVTTATAPLNIPAMYWAWSSGYKFLKADGAVNGAGFNLHLGSTMCGATGTAPPTAACASPNVMDIALSSYTPGTSVIVADVARVLTDVDVTVNTAMTAPGCMSFPGDAECNTIFPKLGLAYGTNAAATQTLFALD